ncbi:MAG: winged helix-turn-helix transcriptional regulator [Saprospiraceae bacterium]|jgi:ArsR family transcriptional regulator|nr:winged helix-turn-helix transcriptional regulator [Saprospiraceae bacterium]
MPLHKKKAFGQEEQELADLAKALAHPARIAILKELARRKSCICGEIVEVLPLAQSTVSQHLKELQQAGLIKGTIEGVKSCYCINPEAFKKMEDMLNAFFTITINDPCC